MRTILTLAVLLFALVAYGFAEARRDPVVRHETLAMPDWPVEAPPVHIALLSDLHLGNAATDSQRLARIARQVSALHPDLILIAGDLVADRAPANHLVSARLVAPLRALHAPLGVVAVLGNHDEWSDKTAIIGALAAANITLLDNAAMTRGPLALGGLGDDFTGHDNLPRTLAAMRRLPGAHVLLAHTPDVGPRLPPDVTLLLAGHTHCGQVVLPLVGAPIQVSRWGARYLCGLVTEGRLRVLVGAGVGTSELPFRLNAPPDLWLLTLGP